MAPALFLGATCPYIVVSFQYKTCKDGSVLGVTVTRIALLTHCQALTQACGYTEGIGGTFWDPPRGALTPDRGL